jgi:hypothetical protein
LTGGGISPPRLCVTEFFELSIARVSSRRATSAPLSQFRERAMGISFDNIDGVIWYDGKLVPWKDANVHVLTHGLHYASAVIEASAPMAAPSSRAPRIPSD